MDARTRLEEQKISREVKETTHRMKAETQVSIHKL